MDKSLYLEKNISQQPAIDLLRSMGYAYISPEDCEAQRGSRYHVLLKDILRGQLRRLNRYAFAGAENEFSAANIERAMEDLDEPLTDGLIRSSEKIYDALLLGKSYPETVGEGKTLSFNLKYIDWEHPENNLFHVTEEFAVDSRDKIHNARPDIVLFINGIPFAVIECKTPQISVEQAVEQNIRNQQKEYIPQLYKFAQIVMATNKNAVKYIRSAQRKFREMAQYAPQPKQYVSGETFYLQGRGVRLKVERNVRDTISSDGIYLHLCVKDTEDFAKKQKMVTRYLDEQCRTVFSEIILEIYPVFQKYGVPMPTLRIRDMETRWGSCLAKKRAITLNKRLLEAPRNCIEYVVMHEFCHFIHPNHSKHFYSFLAMLMPDWKERKTVLDRSATFWL